MKRKKTFELEIEAKDKIKKLALELNLPESTKAIIQRHTGKIFFDVTSQVNKVEKEEEKGQIKIKNLIKKYNKSCEGQQKRSNLLVTFSPLYGGSASLKMLRQNNQYDFMNKLSSSNFNNEVEDPELTQISKQEDNQKNTEQEVENLHNQTLNQPKA